MCVPCCFCEARVARSSSNFRQISAAFLVLAYRPSQVIQKLFQGGHARIRPVFESLARADFNASAIEKPANEADVMEVMENTTKSKGLRIQFKT